MNELIETFYPDPGHGNIRNTVQKDNFIKDLYNGKIRAPKEPIFEFDKNLRSPDQLHDPWGLTVGGHIMNKLVTKRVYQQSDMGGIPHGIYEAAGYRVNDVLERVAFARALGEDYTNIGEKMRIEDHYMPDGQLGEVNTQHMVTRGIVQDLLNRQYKQVSNKIRFFNEERFVNDTKLERLYEQQDNIAAAIDVMDKSMAKNLVQEIRDGRLQHITNKKESNDPMPYKFEDKVYVYRIKGAVKLKDSTIDTGLEGPAKKIDYGDLEHLGFYDKHGSFKTRSKKPLIIQKGYTYIVDKNPRQKVSMTDPEYTYGRAAFEATYGDRTTPEMFMQGDLQTFREQTKSLRNQITSDYIKTSRLAREQRVLKNEIYENANAYEQNTIDKYMKDYAEQVTTDGSLTEIGTLIRYVLQPQPLVREYYSAHDIDMPAYKMNNRLYQSIITWAETNGHGHEINSLTHDIETAASGRRLDHDMSSFTNMSTDRIYDYSRLGAQANVVRTIRENYSGFYASPIFEHQMNMVDTRNMGQTKMVRGVNGEVVGIKMRRPGKDKNRHERGCK